MLYLRVPHQVEAPKCLQSLVQAATNVTGDGAGAGGALATLQVQDSFCTGAPAATLGYGTAMATSTAIVTATGTTIQEGVTIVSFLLGSLIYLP